MDMQETLSTATKLCEVLKETEATLTRITAMMSDPRVGELLEGDQRIYSIPLDGLVTQSEVQKALRTSPMEVNKLVANGELACVTAGSSIKKFPVSEVNRYIRSRRVN